MYCSPIIIGVMKSTRMRWPRCVTGMGRGEVSTGFWWGGLRERERPLGRPRYGWENKIKMDNVEIVWECVDWIDLVQDRDMWWAFVKAVVSLRAA